MGHLLTRQSYVEGAVRHTLTHLQTMSVKLLLTEAFARLSGLAKLTRDEMSPAGRKIVILVELSEASIS
jgi:hypothetical protein